MKRPAARLPVITRELVTRLEAAAADNVALVLAHMQAQPGNPRGAEGPGSPPGRVIAKPMSQRAVLRAAVLVVALLSVGCVAPVGASDTKIPKDGASQCASQCAEMGLRLSAVAIMANNVGCVCQPPPSGQASRGENAVGPAGMATLLMLEQQRQQQQQQQAAATRR